MISLIQALPAGNALRLFLSPPAGASVWRVLRRATGDFTGPDDPGAWLAVPDGTDEVALDAIGLVNGVSYSYQLYALVGDVWVPSDVATATPAASYRDNIIDPQAIVVARLALGLAEEVRRGTLRPQSGKIPVVTAPFAMADGIKLPAVSVHLDLDAPADRAMGEMVFSDAHLTGIGGWDESEGWMSRVQLNIVGVTLNYDERIALRQAIKRIVIANLPVFADLGLLQVEFSQRDSESEGANNAVLYYSGGLFACVAPAVVSATVDEISDVSVTALDFPPPNEAVNG